MDVQTSKSVQGYGAELQDRAEVIRLPQATIAVIADGAGGRSGGAQAAEMVIKMVREYAVADCDLDSAALCGLLRKIDKALEADASAGETTAVIAAISSSGIAGTSVGDSACWLINGPDWADLTRDQQRKPFLGAGVAAPVPFSETSFLGTLLLASDGLTKYTSAENICRMASLPDLDTAASELVSLVRYPSGGLPDDVSVVLLRLRY